MSGLILIMFSINTAVFVYTALHIVEYLKWKRSWRESKNV